LICLNIFLGLALISILLATVVLAGSTKEAAITRRSITPNTIPNIFRNFIVIVWANVRALKR
jgi:hypothetical protein